MFARFAQQENDLLLLAGLKIEGRLQSGARIDRRAGRCRSRLARSSAAGAASEPLRPRNSVRSHVHVRGRSVDVREGHGRRKVRVEAIASQQGARLRVDLGDDAHGRLVADGAEHPFREEGGGQAARLPADVAHFETDQFDRVGRRHEEQQFVIEAAAGIA